MDTTTAIANRRVRRLLDVAIKYGYAVAESEHVSDCWIVRRSSGSSSRYLVVYGEARHACRVVIADDPSGSGFDTVSQSHAITLLVNRAL